MTNPRNDGTLDVSSKEEVYDNADCTGAVIATGTPSPNLVTVVFLETVAGATLKPQAGGQGLVGTIDRVTRSYPTSTYTFVGAGSAVNFVNGVATIWSVPLASGGSTNYRIQNPADTITGAFAILNNDLYVLRAFDASTNSYPVSVRAVRSN